MIRAVQWAVDTAHDLWQITKSLAQKVAKTFNAWWRPPERGWTKCNVDGAFFPDNGQGATGVVLRDHSGAFVYGKAQWYPSCMVIFYIF